MKNFTEVWNFEHGKNLFEGIYLKVYDNFVGLTIVENNPASKRGFNDYILYLNFEKNSDISLLLWQSLTSLFCQNIKNVYNSFRKVLLSLYFNDNFSLEFYAKTSISDNNYNNHYQYKEGENVNTVLSNIYLELQKELS